MGKKQYFYRFLKEKSPPSHFYFAISFCQNFLLSKRINMQYLKQSIAYNSPPFWGGVGVRHYFFLIFPAS